MCFVSLDDSDLQCRVVHHSKFGGPVSQLGQFASDRHARGADAVSASPPIAIKDWHRSETTRGDSGDRGLISPQAPAHDGEIFLGAVGAFAMDSYAARALGGQPIAARKSRFLAGPRLPEPHERSCSRGF